MFGTYLKVAAKDSMNLGDRIFLPITVKELPIEKKELLCNEEEVNFIRSLELYKVFFVGIGDLVCTLFKTNM